MRLLLYVEGETEKCLPSFFSRWLQSRLHNGIQLKPVNFRGAGNYRREFAERARRDLQNAQVLGIVGILDFYGSGLSYPQGSVAVKYRWAKEHLERQVGEPAFLQHFAVHETEAWLLSEPSIFRPEIRPSLPKASQPESVDSARPPSFVLKDLYRSKLDRTYGKALEGSSLFSKLNPETAYARCPHLKLLLDDILALATRSQ